MSADNYYLIRKHPKGGFAAVMGFASDGATPRAHKRDKQFDTVESALLWASNEYSEYGVSIHDECGGAGPATVVPASNDRTRRFVIEVEWGPHGDTPDGVVEEVGEATCEYLMGLLVALGVNDPFVDLELNAPKVAA